MSETVLYDYWRSSASYRVRIALNSLGESYRSVPVDLLAKAHEQATAEEAARELGVTVSRVKSRYERLTRKLEVPNKRLAAEKALALGLIKRS